MRLNCLEPACEAAQSEPRLVKLIRCLYRSAWGGNVDPHGANQVGGAVRHVGSGEAIRFRPERLAR